MNKLYWTFILDKLYGQSCSSILPKKENVIGVCAVQSIENWTVLFSNLMYEMISQFFFG